jgi:hypothetical protein
LTDVYAVIGGRIRELRTKKFSTQENTPFAKGIWEKSGSETPKYVFRLVGGIT